MCQIAFDLIPLPLAEVDENGKVMFANSALLSLCGLTLVEVYKKSFYSFCFLQAEDGAISFRGIKQESVMEVDLEHKSGEKHPYKLKIIPFQDLLSKSKARFFLILEPSQKEYRQQLEQSHKLESLGSLASSIAHDINNILAGVLGHVTFLRLSTSNSGSQLESIAAIEDGARKAAHLTREILDYARNESVGMHPINFSLVIAGGLNLFRGALPKNIQLRVASEKSDVFVLGDESKLSQLCMNLAVNARDALPSGGHIDVRVERVTVDAAKAPRHVGNPPRTLVAGEYARLSIEDDGIGMSKEVQKRIFEPYFTTKEAEGTGLGLATVLSIVESHLGAVEVTSRLGKGTRFDVYIPLCEGFFESEVDEEKDEVIPGGNERILVVDDEEVVRAVIQRSLEHFGYEVDIAKDGLDAVARYQNNRRSYKLVILDMMMPHMSGDEVFRRLREIDRDAKVLLVSGFSSEERAQSVLKSGGLGFIQKPFAVEELAREVRRCLDAAS